MLDPIVHADPGDENDSKENWLDDLDSLSQEEIDDLFDLTGVCI